MVMATNLSVIGLENLTKSSEWRSVSFNVSQDRNSQQIQNSMTRLGTEIEITILERLKEYCSTIDGLRSEIQSLHNENAKIRDEFKEVLTALTIKKPVGEEIAELQSRIMKLYAEEGKN